MCVLTMGHTFVVVVQGEFALVQQPDDLGGQFDAGLALVQLQEASGAVGGDLDRIRKPGGGRMPRTDGRVSAAVGDDASDARHVGRGRTRYRTTARPRSTSRRPCTIRSSSPGGPGAIPTWPRIGALGEPRCGRSAASGNNSPPGGPRPTPIMVVRRRRLRPPHNTRSPVIATCYRSMSTTTYSSMFGRRCKPLPKRAPIRSNVLRYQAQGRPVARKSVAGCAGGQHATGHTAPSSVACFLPPAPWR